MQTESTAPVIRLPAVSADGVLFLYSPNLALRVHYGSLAVDLGRGRSLKVGRASQPRLRRLVISGHGWSSFEVSSWIAGIGASWVHLDLTGHVLGSGPAGVSPDLPALRRAQCLAAGTDAGLAIGRDLLSTKLAGQAAALAHAPGADSAHDAILASRAALEGCEDAGRLRNEEARAANEFWGALADLPVHYISADRDKVPATWLSVGRRASVLSGSPRSAATPAHSLWNYAYSLAATEVSACLRSVGLDPGISPTGLHADTPNREGATWDVLEAVRGEVDQAIIKMLSVRRFRRRDFVERPTGGVRLTAPLARDLAEAILPLARQAAGSVCEGLARSLAESFRGPRSHVSKRPTNLTGDARSRGRDAIRRGPRKEENAGTQAARTLAPSACRSCGVILEAGRVVCDDCLPGVQQENTRTFVDAGRRNLAAMRARADDPSRTREAKAKAGASVSRRLAENREWERTHELPDPSEWEVIFAALADVPVRAIQRATGLAPSTCHRIKLGEGRAHPRHWLALRNI